MRMLTIVSFSIILTLTLGDGVGWDGLGEGLAANSGGDRRSQSYPRRGPDSVSHWLPHPADHTFERVPTSAAWRARGRPCQTDGTLT